MLKITQKLNIYSTILTILFGFLSLNLSANEHRQMEKNDSFSLKFENELVPFVPEVTLDGKPINLKRLKSSLRQCLNFHIR